MEQKKLWKCEIDGRSIDQQKQNKMWTLICAHTQNLHNIDLHTQKKFAKHLSTHTWMHMLDMYNTPPKLDDGKKSHKLKPFV
jgi:hypothetical protein